MHQKVIGLEEETFKVLANHKRLEILQLLKHQSLNVNEMVQMLGLSQPNLSQHLTLLRHYGLVKVKRQGQKAYYSLADNKITKAVEMIYQFLQNQYSFSDDFPAKLLFPIVKDVICSMRLSASEAFEKSTHHGETYYFCASGCQQRFTANPAKYVTAKKGV